MLHSLSRIKLGFLLSEDHDVLLGSEFFLDVDEGLEIQDHLNLGLVYVKRPVFLHSGEGHCHDGNQHVHEQQEHDYQGGAKHDPSR
jgi:hypothetical protein